MPATTPNPNKVDPKQNGNAAPLYVKCDLSREQKELVKAWAEEVEYVDVVKWIEFHADDGQTLSVKHIVGQDGYQASLTGNELSTNKKGKCLISRASTAWRAILGLMYKDTLVLEGQWTVMERQLDLDL
jgi:hypothetical protein